MDQGFIPGQCSKDYYSLVLFGSDISDMVKTSNEVLDSAKNSMQNVDSITAKIDQREGTIGFLVNDKRMYNQATAATAEKLRSSSIRLARLRLRFKRRVPRNTE